jgi:hypothetical protein
VVAQQPQHAILVPIGRASTDLAQQSAHCTALSQGMDLTKLRPALTGTRWNASPQDAVAIAVQDGLIGEADS